MIRIVVGCAICAVVLLAPTVVAQSDSAIKQQITPVKCSYTTVASGMGAVHDSTCPVFAPTIESVNPNRGRPIIRGIYDAVHASVFRVQIAGLWYVLGEDPELTASGNVWELNLSGLEYPLPEGSHPVIVEMRADDNSLLQTGGAVKIIAQDTVSRPMSGAEAPDGGPSESRGDGVSDSPESPGEATSKPGNAEGGDERPDWIIPLALILATGGAWLAVVAIRRYK